MAVAGSAPFLVVTTGVSDPQLTGTCPRSAVLVPVFTLVSIVGWGVTVLHSKSAPTDESAKPEPVTVVDRFEPEAMGALWLKLIDGVAAEATAAPASSATPAAITATPNTATRLAESLAPRRCFPRTTPPSLMRQAIAFSRRPS
jgi:hypothetical protein